VNPFTSQRLKYVADVRFSNVDKLSEPDEIPVRLCNYTDVYKNERITHDMPFMEATASAAEIRRFGLHVDDVIFTKDSESPTDIAVPAVVASTAPDLVCGYHLAIARPHTARLSGRFLLRALQATGVREQFYMQANGVTRFGLSQAAIGNVRVPVPPLNEQARIADFLDRKTASIDTLIEKQEQLLALLAEKRQALITQAVTKGLDPNVPMKDSGVEWIGAIPAVWRVARIRHVAKLESGHTPSRQHPEWWIPDECTIPWVSLADVWKLRDGVTEYISDTTEKISEAGLANSSARLLPAKTVILSRTASVGFSAIISVPMATTQDFVNWICGPSVLPEYLLYVLRAMKPEFARLTQGSVHRTIYMPDVARLVMPVPSLGEQQRIVTHVRSELRRLDAISQRVQAMIEKLREYRQALITAAVTGQLDVTSGAAATSAPKPYAEAVGT